MNINFRKKIECDFTLGIFCIEHFLTQLLKKNEIN